MKKISGNGTTEADGRMRSRDQAQECAVPPARHSEEERTVSRSSGNERGDAPEIQTGQIDEPAGNTVFLSSEGNTLEIVPSQDGTSILLTLSGRTLVFAGTESGAADACRAAAENGDREMIRRTQELFSGGEAAVHEALPENQQYVEDTLSRLQEGLPEIFDRDMVNAGAEIRQLRKPHATASDGELKGTWRDSVFYPEDDYVPPLYTDAHLTMGQIRQRLKENCGLTFEGIPFQDGVADFSSISVATISTRDIVMEAREMSPEAYESLEPTEKAVLFSEVFTRERRNENFRIADRLAAERKIPIRGLPEGYTPDDLEEWRGDPEHQFTWDEQVHGGYNLVPTIIHGNISHTGLVSSPSKALAYFERRENEGAEKYSFSEENAPISVSGFVEEYS